MGIWAAKAVVDENGRRGEVGRKPAVLLVVSSNRATSWASGLCVKVLMLQNVDNERDNAPQKSSNNQCQALVQTKDGISLSMNDEATRGRWQRPGTKIATQVSRAFCAFVAQLVNRELSVRVARRA